MPLQRRLPKRGFTNIFKKVWIEVNLSQLDAKFTANDEVTPELMAERGMIRKSYLKRGEGVVILGRGDLTKALAVSAHRFTSGAREKIETSGGKITVLEAVTLRRGGADSSSPTVTKG